MATTHTVFLYTEDGSFSSMTRVAQSLLFHNIPATTSLCVVGDSATGAVHHALRVETAASRDAVERWVTKSGAVLRITDVHFRGA